MEKIAEGISTGYDLQTYVWMLKSAAMIADEGRGLKRNGFGTYMADLHDDDDDGPQVREHNQHNLMPDVDDDGEIQEGVVELLAFQARRARPGARMNKATWDSLTKEAQATWDALADSEKIKILRYASARGSDGKKDGKPSRSVNIIEITDDDEDEESGALKVNQTKKSRVPIQLIHQR